MQKKLHSTCCVVIRKAAYFIRQPRKAHPLAEYSSCQMIISQMKISHSLTTLTREILFLPLEHEMHIFSLNIEERWGWNWPRIQKNTRRMFRPVLCKSHVRNCRWSSAPLSIHIKITENLLENIFSVSKQEKRKNIHFRLRRAFLKRPENFTGPKLRPAFTL